MKHFFIIFYITFITSFAFAEDITFKTLKEETHVRSGPAKNYPILFTFKAKNIPLKVLRRYEGFSQIQDYHGKKGWVVDNRLKKSKYVYIFKDSIGYKNKKQGSDKVFEIYAPQVALLKKCDDKFCQIEFNKKKAWINKSNCWGDIQ